jgi:hypothetical protein
MAACPTGVLRESRLGYKIHGKLAVDEPANSPNLGISKTCGLNLNYLDWFLKLDYYLTY